MKKLICLVLAVLLTLSAVSVFAEGYTDKDTVKKVQQALNDAGYDCGTPDGAAGKKTKAAITSYQTDKGLTVTGVIDDELLLALGLTEAETDEEAPAETDEGYTFQGIPWGSSPKEVEAILVENGLIQEETTLSISNGTVFFPEKLDEMEVLNLAKAAFAVNDIGGNTLLSGTEILKAIGGCEVFGIRFDFLHGINESIVDDNYGLTLVSIQFQSDDASFEKLTEGLRKQYGDYSSSSVNNWKYRQWNGSNHTVVSLMCTGDISFLVYAESDGYLAAQQIQEAIEANKTPSEDAGL